MLIKVMTMKMTVVIFSVLFPRMKSGPRSQVSVQEVTGFRSLAQTHTFILATEV